MARLLILLVGMPGSGKSVFTRAAREAGIPAVSMGDVVRLEATKRGLGVSNETLAQLSVELRATYGPDVIARRAADRLPEKPVVVIDGVRSLDEVEYFRAISEKTIIVAIHSSPARRFERLLKRGRVDDPRSWDEFKARDRRELAFGIGDVIALSDIMIVNEEEGIEAFRRKCRMVLDKILREAPGQE